MSVSLSNIQIIDTFYNRSPVFSSRKTAMPSIILAAELPKNLLLGFKVPSMRILCSGAMKK
jgi:hypothetical protein